MSLETILPFLEPIAHLILDPDISEIMLNPDGRIFTERGGQMEFVNATITPANAQFAIKRIAHMADQEIDQERPTLEVQLPDGSRLSAICPPITEDWCFTLRKHSKRTFTLEHLVQLGTITERMREALTAAVVDRKTILISGGTGAGKTSLLNALAGCFDPDDRIITIEDVKEIQLPNSRNVSRFESRIERDGLPAVTTRDLVKRAMRHRPDRIIVGEVRGAEALDMLQSMNSGHPGSMSTIHASSAPAALYKLANYAAMAGDIPLAALKPEIAEAIQIVIQITRKPRARIVEHAVTVDSYDRANDLFQTTDLLTKGR